VRTVRAVSSSLFTPPEGPSASSRSGSLGPYDGIEGGARRILRGEPGGRVVRVDRKRSLVQASPTPGPV